MQNYDKAIMPNGNDTVKFLLRMEMVLTGIVEVDAKNQRALITAWMKMEWSDSRIQWNVTENSNLRSLPFSQEDIYIPEVILFNRYRVRSSEIFGSSMAVVYSSGEVTWVPAASLEVPCNMSLTTWPNDQHECVFIFGHASRDSSTFELTPSSSDVSLESFSPTSAQWKLVTSRTELSHSYGFQDGVDNVRFCITVQRVSTPLLRSLTFVPVLLLLMSVGVLVIADPSFRFLYATLNLAWGLALGLFMWHVVPYSEEPVKIVRLLSWSPVSLFVALCIAAFLDFMECLRLPLPRFLNNLCQWNFLDVLKSRWPWNRRNTNLSFRTSSENLILSDDVDRARNLPSTRLFCDFAPCWRICFLLVHGVAIGILSLTVVP
ncbi:hypothetical protein RvY_13688-2 [Ramazzottius varieornatus]|nr:hypothetical protein RvY_13688-2 [Ramazzottius varieornatus]